ncbi:hypothetical protein BCR34DRAFT_571774 [Clohesyomyces aquaticus]|uniref:Uncharacterized protein n=1 Tax=Clohesyomyces aquaticus TaxID=1231657 RepID=A0A1Y1Z762_9PLEO|nr:hypothetical protein BCR34DRAFT_571774 [Clohesyomyces aquaticus]
MGSRRVGGLLLRPSPLFTTSTICSRPHPPLPFQRLSRTLHATPPLLAAQPSPKPTATLEPQNDEPPTATQPSTSSTIDSIMGVSPARRTATSADQFGAAYRSARTFGGPRFSSPPGQPQSSFGENFSKPNNAWKRPSLDFSAMDMPMSPGGPGQEQGLGVPQPAMPAAPEVYPRLNPSTGRTVELDVSKGRDLVRGLGMLGSLMARNKVKNDFMKQRFHERPGLKRKRLKSERWRANFKVGFRDVVGRVSELTRKGW